MNCSTGAKDWKFYRSDMQYSAKFEVQWHTVNGQWHTCMGGDGLAVQNWVLNEIGSDAQYIGLAAVSIELGLWR